MPNDNSSNAVNLANPDKQTTPMSSEGDWNGSHKPGALVVGRTLSIKCPLELADFMEARNDAECRPVTLPETSQARLKRATLCHTTSLH